MSELEVHIADCSLKSFGKKKVVTLRSFLSSSEITFHE